MQTVALRTPMQRWTMLNAFISGLTIILRGYYVYKIKLE